MISVDKMNEASNEGRALAVAKASFESEVLRSNRPVLVVFWAPWSQPCRVLGTVLDDIMSGCARRVKFVQISADDNPGLSLWYGIQSIPTLLYFINGVVLARIVGTTSKEAILAMLESDTRSDGPTSPISESSKENEHNHP